MSVIAFIIIFWIIVGFAWSRSPIPKEDTVGWYRALAWLVAIPVVIWGCIEYVIVKVAKFINSKF